MSQFNTPNYEIPRATGRCAATDDPLEPGQAYYAVLVELPAEPPDPAAAHQSPNEAASNALGLTRLDVCEKAWLDGYRPQGLFCHWKSVVPEPNQKKKLFVDDSILLNLLRRLEGAQEPQRLAFRYVLALILMRKKLLRYDGTDWRTEQVEGQDIRRGWWKLTPKLDLSKGPLGKWSPDETIVVLDPQLDESQIEQVTTQLGEILEAEL